MRKYCKSLTSELYHRIKDDIKEIHFASCLGSYQLLVRKIEHSWKKDQSLSKFAKYFFKQWIYSAFNNWQIFRTPGGYASTNCSIESYNNVIKTQFLDRLTYPIMSAIDNFKKLLKYESLNMKNELSKIVNVFL